MLDQAQKWEATVEKKKEELKGLLQSVVLQFMLDNSALDVEGEMPITPYVVTDSLIEMGTVSYIVAEGFELPEFMSYVASTYLETAEIIDDGMHFLDAAKALVL